jgi:hypothetical protein
MQRGCIETHVAKCLPTPLVLALEIFLHRQLAGTNHEQTVDVRVLTRARQVG